MFKISENYPSHHRSVSQTLLLNDKKKIEILNIFSTDVTDMPCFYRAGYIFILIVTYIACLKWNRIYAIEMVATSSYEEHVHNSILIDFFRDPQQKIAEE